MNKILDNNRRFGHWPIAVELIAVTVLPLLLAMTVLHLWKWDLSVAMIYGKTDDIWQLFLTKTLIDTGWILENPFVGAPDIAHWQFHSAAQTSAIHSIIMRGMSLFIDDAVRLQQSYYLLNFSLISLSSYCVCRVLGIRGFIAVSIGLLFSFTSFRLDWMFYAFLANYASIPLALIPVFWILIGRFSDYFPVGQPSKQGLSQLLCGKHIWISLLCVVLITLSDGYYAFFTLLLLGFASLMRVFAGDLSRPAKLLAPIALIVTLIVVALLMDMPLSAYKKAHHDEFYPNGIPDSTLIKRPMEAEVYSTSIKLLVAPTVNHRIPQLARIGKVMVATSDEAQTFPTRKPMMSLGILGSLLLLSCLLGLAWLLIRQALPGGTGPLPPFMRDNGYLWIAVALTFFILLFSIFGGLGTLVALVYPTIRAYGRFPLFMIFCLFIVGGTALSGYLRGANRRKNLIAIIVVGLLTVAGLYDQIPAESNKGDDTATRDRFLADRHVVREMESVLPAGAMVYQYPHSQYLSNNRYYGWGSFAQLRLYLHSKTLRWSNGASKNSPVENWHEKIAVLPLDDLLTEVMAVGFKSVIIDRKVLPVSDYQAMTEALTRRGMLLHIDAASGLTYALLSDPGYRAIYNPSYDELDRVVVSDRARTIAGPLPRLLHGAALRAYLEQAPAHTPMTIARAAQPQLFVAAIQSARGAGDKPIMPVSAMQGLFQCAIESNAAVAHAADTLRLTLVNKTSFDWQLGTGGFPMWVGMHVLAPDGSTLRFDDGFRMPVTPFVGTGSSTTVKFPLAELKLAGLASAGGTIRLQFALVQEGHAWFNDLSCSIPYQN